MNVRRIFRVMLSSTFEDLEEKRAEILRLLGGHDLHEVAMEHSPARPTLDRRASSLQMVTSADAYIGIIGYRYGRRVRPEYLSLTEIEWRYARQRRIPCCFLLMSDEYAVPRRLIEAVSGEDRNSLAAFRKQVEEEVVCAYFKDDTEFTVMATNSLVELRRTLDALHRTAASTTLSSTAEPGKPAAAHQWQDDAGLELLCDRNPAVKRFEDELQNRRDPLRPGCLLVFGEEDQAHGAFFDRIRYTLRGRAYFKRYGSPETVHLPFEREFYEMHVDIAVHVLRTALRHIDGDAGGGELDELSKALYRALKRRRVALCLINCLVHVESHNEARWWIERFQELRQQMKLEQGGPQIMLSIAIQYPRGFWLLRGRRDLTRFFRRNFPAAFPELVTRRSHKWLGFETSGLTALRLTSATRAHVNQWCEEPQVRCHLQSARISRNTILQPFERSGEKPMWDVLEHLRGVLQNHPA